MHTVKSSNIVKFFETRIIPIVTITPSIHHLFNYIFDVSGARFWNNRIREDQSS
ncbi:hypothetical protein C7S16_0273 [Burkholderia thailandensis]|uniref:Uncharacterized protein n=1 Tax=Burkholderia thailandensis TaxID=57975 RepID=A0AAW9CUT9_BURTH|nr:hypothetical protein [Burkholderia thailandensis]MDW9254648.1 hypothetical protein [Burkholderia thailandensis]